MRGAVRKDEERSLLLLTLRPFTFIVLMVYVILCNNAQSYAYEECLHNRETIPANGVCASGNITCNYEHQSDTTFAKDFNVNTVDPPTAAYTFGAIVITDEKGLITVVSRSSINYGQQASAPNGVVIYNTTYSADGTQVLSIKQIQFIKGSTVTGTAQDTFAGALAFSRTSADTIVAGDDTNNYAYVYKLNSNTQQYQHFQTISTSAYVKSSYGMAIDISSDGTVFVIKNVQQTGYALYKYDGTSYALIRQVALSGSSYYRYAFKCNKDCSEVVIYDGSGASSYMRFYYDFINNENYVTIPSTWSIPTQCFDTSITSPIDIDENRLVIGCYYANQVEICKIDRSVTPLKLSLEQTISGSALLVKSCSSSADNFYPSSTTYFGSSTYLGKTSPSFLYIGDNEGSMCYGSSSDTNGYMYKFVYDNTTLQYEQITSLLPINSLQSSQCKASYGCSNALGYGWSISSTDMDSFQAVSDPNYRAATVGGYVNFYVGPTQLLRNQSYASTDTICASATACSAATHCSGGSVNCPFYSTNVYNSTVVCHKPKGLCEIAVTCSGVNSTCGPTQYYGSSHMCRAASGCSGPSYCTFGNETCPPAKPIGSDTIIHQPQGPCEKQVNCSATSTIVPPRQYYGSNYVCSIGGQCTANATCTFGNETCPTKGPIGSSVIIHYPQGPCEKQVNCSATSTIVPPRQYYSSNHVCSIGGQCTANATCTFGNETCPTKQPIGSDVIIHYSQGPCEKQVNCSASTTAVPPRQYYGSSYVCSYGGACTANATCTLGTANCPAKQPIGSNVIIHYPQGPCEKQVNCSATSTIVPPRQYYGSSYVCSYGGGCTANATCRFGNETCPTKQPIGSNVIIHYPKGSCEKQVNCSASTTVVPPRQFFGSNYVCSLGGQCTANATCTFGNETCPTKQPIGSNVIIHYPKGSCEKQVNCSASTTVVPSRQFFGNNYVCSLGGQCTANATCTLGNETCPTKQPIGSDIIIHYPKGPCEKQVNCSSSSTTVPPRLYYGNNVVCSIGGQCTANATCTYGNETCPTKGPRGSNVIIHYPQGPCEKQVNCSASTTIVPSRQFFGSNYVCSLGGNCTANATCIYGNQSCPTKAPRGSNIIIHYPQGPCERQVNCSANTTIIPPRRFFSSNYVCSLGGNCTANATCTFGNQSCPIKGPRGSNIIIHYPQGPCEKQVNCSASTTLVPPRQYFGSNYVCSLGGNCTANATCTYGNESCPIKGPRGSSVIIHYPRGPCEKRTNCSANTTVIPPRQFFGSNYICSLGGNCTSNATCTYGNETCPTKQARGSSVIIHYPQGPCERQVNCSANTTVIPPRKFFGSNYVCSFGGNCTANATCIYGNQTCPTKGPRGSSVIIHYPRGPCEMEVYCNANSTKVPVRRFYNSTHMCRAPTGCSAAAYCTFGNESCPHPKPIGSEKIIHYPQGACEKQINCTANSTAIPPRVFYNNTYVCAYGGNCTANSTCTFGNETCPIQKPLGNKIIIHYARGLCEKQVNCSATSTLIPPRQFFGSSYMCSAAINCTASSYCTYGNESCPLAKPIGTQKIIHYPQGPCEKLVTCRANSTVVPSRQYYGASVECANATTCHNASFCLYGNATCPKRRVLDNSTVCHNATSCSTEGRCNHTSAKCEYTVFGPNRRCRNITYECEQEAYCMGGINYTCPPNPLLPHGTKCDAITPGDEDTCVMAGVCDGTHKRCQNSTFVKDGTPCVPGKILNYNYLHEECYNQGKCESGACVGAGFKTLGEPCVPAGHACIVGHCDDHGTCLVHNMTACKNDDLFT